MKQYFSLIAKAGFIPLLLILSCTSATLYTINMNYTPSETVSTGSDGMENIRFTVAEFIDSRNMEDRMMIGSVVSGDGAITPVTPKHLKPVDAVTSGVRKCLSAAGYSLSPEIPVWNPGNNSIGAQPGDILIGGTIDTLEVLCRKDVIKKHYQANVKLSIVFADVRTSRIFHKIETEASPSLVHIQFSEEILEEQINKALSASIEQVFGDKEKMRKIVKEIPEK